MEHLSWVTAHTVPLKAASVCSSHATLCKATLGHHPGDTRMEPQSELAGLATFQWTFFTLRHSVMTCH